MYVQEEFDLVSFQDVWIEEKQKDLQCLVKTKSKKRKGTESCSRTSSLAFCPPHNAFSRDTRQKHQT